MEGGGGLQATDDLRQQRHARSRSRRTLRHSLGREDGPDDCRSRERPFDDDSSSRLTQYEPATEATTLSCLASGQPTCSSGCWLREVPDDDADDDMFEAAITYGGREEQRFQGLRLDKDDERLVEWRRPRLRSPGSWHLRSALDMAARTLLLGVVLLVTPGLCNHQDAVHITAILGESVVFNCHVEFPDQHPVPYVLQWEKKVGDTVRYRATNQQSVASPSLLSVRELKSRAPLAKAALLVPANSPAALLLPEQLRNKLALRHHTLKPKLASGENQSIDVGFLGQEIPIYIWYESYPTHSGEGYEGRVSKVGPNSPYGGASLNLTNIQESDQGWYECKVVFLNRSPNSNKNGTWFHLDVHAPPRFTITPEEMIYVNLGDAIILNCQAEGTPTPEILWYKDANPVEPSSTVTIINDGTELRISTIKTEDIGDYTCLARNGEGQISHTARVIIAGGAVITTPPQNETKLEGENVVFPCEAKALPGNVTVSWYREGAPISEVSELDTRASVRMDGSLAINPVSADDSGTYLCTVSNGIGEPQTASAYLNVEYPAKVTFNPTVQYLPFRMAGVVQCYIKANPPLQYVTWTKDKRLLEPYQVKDIVVMGNGSLLFTRVNENHHGQYTCTPYNAHGTQGSSGYMEVLVRNPPVFTVEPQPMYQRKVGETVEMHCAAQESPGTQKPTVTWQRKDGEELARGRAKVVVGNLTIENLKQQDFGVYECVVSNEVATIVKSTHLIVEGTQPHAPHNVTGVADQFSVTLSWQPGYSGGPDYKQDYTIWHREEGAQEWKTIPVTPSGSTTVTISRLKSGTNHEFQVVGKNALGDGMSSGIITVRTLDVELQKAPTQSSTSGNQIPAAAADQSGGGLGLPLKEKVTPDDGPRPGPPRNVTVTEINNGFLITWMPPLERSHLVKFYTINFKTDGPWKTLNKGQIRPEDTSYLMKNLVGGRTYYFVVFANSSDSAGASEQYKYSVPARVKHKAITAGVVGGILFFIVAIILSICAVKICNKRKRRKQEKELLSAYNMVTCRVTDARNGAGQGPQGTVPLKKPRKSRVPGLSLLRELISPATPDLTRRCRPLGKISRAADGRFVIADSVMSSANNSILDASSSDDGGFLPKQHQRLKSSWRRPLVGTSQLSLRSEGSGLSNLQPQQQPVQVGQVGQVVLPGHHLLASVVGPSPQLTSPGLVGGTPVAANAAGICTIASPRFLASSPSCGPQSAPWSSPVYLSDLSSVRPANSTVERSNSYFPTPPSYLQLRTVHQRYSQELPSLKAIHAECTQRFVPVQPLATSSPPQPAGRPRARLPPRHARHARSAPELAASPDLETSPESRSSSSGFGSKNTSQQNQSSRSGSTVAECCPPPYRPPPPPASVGRWLEHHHPALKSCVNLISIGLPGSGCGGGGANLDAGSVDGHYEFDPVSCTPTPTSASTPTREERPPVHQMNHHHHHHHHQLPQIHQVHTSQQQPASARYSRDNIEARVQAMKAEFHQFRQRQAKRRQSAHLESAC